MTQENTALLEALEKIANYHDHRDIGAELRMSEMIAAMQKIAKGALSTSTPAQVEAARPTPTTDSLTADAAAVREAAAIAARDAMVAMEWPPQDGDRQIDEVMASIRDMPLPTQTVPADVAALVVAAREASYAFSGLFEDSSEADALDALDKALEPFASRVCWDDEGGSLPDAHAVPCSCGKGGEA